ncbi:MAG: hypothetical protein H7839_12730 [Magnetococcus sp. YQC-5]
MTPTENERQDGQSVPVLCERIRNHAESAEQTGNQMREVLWEIDHHRLYTQLPTGYSDLRPYFRDQIKYTPSYLYRQLRAGKTEHLWGVPFNTYPEKVLMHISATNVPDEVKHAAFTAAQNADHQQIPSAEILRIKIAETLKEYKAQVNKSGTQEAQQLLPNLPDIMSLPDDYVLRVFEEKFVTLPLDRQLASMSSWLTTLPAGVRQNILEALSAQEPEVSNIQDVAA